MTVIVLTTQHVLKISAQIPVHLLNHVVKMRNVKRQLTDLFADVQQIGLAILMKNVTNVRFLNIYRLRSQHLKRLKTVEIKNPSNFIFLDECQINDDCPYNKECKQNECQNPCLSIICGQRAECKAEAHRAVCFCPRGLQGNPLIACSEVGCSSDSDCSDREKCDYETSSSTKKECIPLCTTSPCTSGATCSARNHREICTCNYPLQGDGYVSCTERKI